MQQFQNYFQQPNMNNNPYYQGNYSFQNPYQNYQNNLQNLQNTVNQIPQNNVLSGRIIENANEITANEINMDGSASYFPQNDGKQIIVKRWNSNGLISTQVYKAENDTEVVETNNVSSNDIKSLESTFNSFRDDVFKELETIKNSLSTRKNTKKEIDNNV